MKLPNDKASGAEVITLKDAASMAELLCEVLNAAKYEKFGILTIFEAIEASNRAKEFDRVFFMRKFAIWCHTNDLVEHPVAEEVYRLCDRILETTGRNYRVLDLIRAYKTILETWKNYV